MFGSYRTFLALMVVIQHLGGVPTIGSYAVFGFYILSGYLMTLIMHSSYGYSFWGFCKYGINRFLRIFPMYWASIAFSLALIGVFGGDFTRGYHDAIYVPDTLNGWIKNLFILFPDLNSARLTPPAWALTVELFYYLLIGMGFSRSARLSVVFLLVGVIYHGVALCFGFDRYFSIQAALLPFAFGCVIYHYNKSIFNRLKSFLAIRYFPHMLMGLFLVNGLLGTNQQFDLLTFYFNIIICVALVTVLSNVREIVLIPKGLDSWLGDFSYPIYLIHFQAGMLILVFMSSVGWPVERPHIFLMILSLPLIFVISWLIILLLERPLDLLRGKIKKRKGEDSIT